MAHELISKTTPDAESGVASIRQRHAKANLGSPVKATFVVMLCSAGPGGMRSVVESYRRDGLFDKWDVRWLHTHVDGNLAQRLRVMLLALGQFVAWAFSKQVTLVHAHVAMRGSFWRKSLFASLARLFHIPVIFHLHGSETKVFYAQQGRLGKRLITRQFEKASMVILLSESWREFVLKIAPRARVAVVPNYVRLPVLTTRPSKRRVRILFLGVLGHRKGIYDLLEAMPRVLAANPDVELMVGGNGEIDVVRSKVSAARLEQNVSVLGWVSGDQKEELLRGADILVLPSYNEGFPMSLLEAMSYGLPVIASRAGGIPELVRDGVDGILVDAGDVGAIGAAVLRLAIDPAERARMGDAARRRVESHFSDRQLLPEIDRLYERVQGGA